MSFEIRFLGAEEGDPVATLFSVPMAAAGLPGTALLAYDVGYRRIYPAVY
jgi:hypothetical protein